MATRISIPSSDDASTRGGRTHHPGSRRKWVVAAALLVLGVAYLLRQGPREAPIEAADLIVASPTDAPVNSELLQYPPVVVEATGFPGTGAVTAILDDGAVLTVFVAESYAGTAVWQSETGSSAWQIVDQFPGVDIVDAAYFDGTVVAVGIQSESRAGIVVSGDFGAMTPLDIGLDRLETPHEVAVAGDEVFVMTRRGDPAFADIGGRVFRSRDASRFIAEAVGPASHGVETVVLSNDRMLAFGRAGSTPAGWDITQPGDPQRLQLDLGEFEGSIRAAAQSPTGDLLGLVSDSLGFRIPGTAVYNLEPPFEQLTVPVPGVWDRLVRDGDTLVALPVEGSRTMVTTDGRVWSLREERFDPLDVGLTPQGAEQSKLPLQIVAYSATSDRVIVGGRGGPDGSVPIIGSRRDVGRAFEVPTDAWVLADDLAGEVLVHHFGALQIGLLNDVVVIREGFGDDWTQPVFAGERSVGALTDVIETELGFLILTQRPVPLLWFSRTGSAWEPIASDVVGVAAHDAEILIVGSDVNGLTVTRISDGVVELLDSNLADFASTGREMDWVEGLGYVFGPVDGELIASLDGAFWTVVPTPIEVRELAISAGQLAIIDSRGTSMGYRFKADAFEPGAPPDLSEVAFQSFVHRGLLTILSSAGNYVSRDAINWFDVSTGIWHGVDGFLYDAWILEDEMIGLIGDGNHRALYRRPVSPVTSTR